MGDRTYTKISVRNNQPILIGTYNSIAFLSFLNYKNYCFQIDSGPTRYSQSAEIALDLKGEEVKIIVSDGKNNKIDLKIFNDKQLNICFLA